MTYFITSITFLIIGYLIGYLITNRKSKIEINKVYEKLRMGTGKMGIIQFHNSFSGDHGIIEIEELEVAGEMTKILIHDVIPDRSSGTKNKEDLLKKWGGNDWVKTHTIIWYNDNTQRIRDIKLKEILDKK